MGASVVALRCRTSDRTTAGARGAGALAPLLAERLGVEARLVGALGEAHAGDFADDLRDSRGCLLEAGGQVDDALSAGDVPFLLAGDCSVCITTLPTVWRHRPEVRVLWLDAHGDFNTPDTTASRFLGGMCLAGACGLWDTGFPETIPTGRLVLAGVRALDADERELLERSDATVIGDTLETLVYVQNALDRCPVYVHLDLDVLDGLSPEKLYDVLEAVVDECELVGAELTGFDGPVSTALHVAQPLLEAAMRGAHVSH